MEELYKIIQEDYGLDGNVTITIHRSYNKIVDNADAAFQILLAMTHGMQKCIVERYEVDRYAWCCAEGGESGRLKITIFHK
jgi:hypothetical protein